MQIGVDVSGAFEMGEGFEPTVIGAAIGATSTFLEIERWTADALERWGLADKLGELHAKELFADKVHEICQMLAGRKNLRLASVVTDSQLLRSAVAVARRRELQRARAEEARPKTEDGRRRRDAVLALLDDPKLRGAAYASGTTMPIVVNLALQQALCYFRTDADRADMTTIELLVDEEPARTVEYTSDTLLPTIGGDPRFSLTLDLRWRDPPVHPLLVRALHPDGDGLQPQELLSTIEYVDSSDHRCVQVADIAASVVRRRILDPTSREDRENFELLKPLLAGAEGRCFEVFSISSLRDDQVSMYAHLHASEPRWWLARGVRSM